MNPQVSVVLPTYNRAQTLERSIRSVLNQTFTDFELIIVDDGSTDESNSILRKFADLTNVILASRPRRGCSAARNYGIRVARGRYVAFQDSDDEWMPDKLAKAVAALEQSDKDTGVFYSDMLIVRSDGSVTDFRAPQLKPGVLINEDTRDYQVHSIGIQSAVIKRECFESVGYFDEALPRLIDLEIFIRLSDKFRFVHSDETLVRFYLGEGISTDGKALIKARRHLLAKYRRRLKLQSHHLAWQYVHLALALDENDRKYLSMLCFLRAFLASPNHPEIRREVSDAMRRYRGRSISERPNQSLT
ncbi:MAG TPA: glycosyltransferase [Pyrinomonadaceae bacterium]|nr:glycosyltransferase [Pyrinomonadaceae bacterium]